MKTPKTYIKKLLDRVIEKQKNRGAPKPEYGLCGDLADAVDDLISSVRIAGQPARDKLIEKKEKQLHVLRAKIDDLRAKIELIEKKEKQLHVLRAKIDDLRAKIDEMNEKADKLEADIENLHYLENEELPEYELIQEAAEEIQYNIDEDLGAGGNYLYEWLIDTGRATRGEIFSTAGREKLRTTRIAWAKDLKRRLTK